MNKEEFSRRIAVRKIPAEGLSLELTASPEELAELAARLGILSCESLTARLLLTAHEGGRKVRGVGRFQARVTQACVVSLEPVEQAIDEPLSLLFQEEEEAPLAEVVIDLNLDPDDDDDVAEPIERGEIDVGAPISEHLALALDPYPRRAGAEFSPPRAPAEEAEKPVHPFAALRALRGGRDDDTNGNET